MHPLLRSLFSSGPGVRTSQLYRRASVSGATLALSMAAYYSNVVVRPSPAAEAQEFDTKAHHIQNRHGKTIKFRNPYPSSQSISGWDIFKITTIEPLTGSLVWPKPKPEDKVVPVVKPEFLPTRASSKLRATWLGHACYYVEYPSGLRVLFDPVFEDCCAPVSMQAFRRYTEPPCDIASLPFVDAVVISHSHYDHLSYPTVQAIQKHHPNAHFFVGLGLQKWFKQGGLNNVTELDWWQEAELTLSPQAGKAAEAKADDGPAPSESITARISCLPCQHSSGRSAFDRDTTLWCSWAVTSGDPAKSVWFGGDTGYRAVPKAPAGTDYEGPDYQHLPVCPQFRQIGEKFGSFDLGLIPIGAYCPRPVFSSVHACPADSVEIFLATKCKRAMAIHWGTWILTPEPVLEPPKLLREALKRKGLAETGLFDICDIGESREF
ncbi:Metallo-hydrolase/oxidoreductase [Durotheca rogersii]|uniref:Metallo-hydrolase/oxidoreductase n=1 Tax=Durotheca rogersii TaxID=419775 RepID=UPI00221FE09B|nr:Metallo-hydrolase/oxidoreductase [Durotheca rogersii]KAI5866211.1 Metallo-hydrolase/oxidoreductase [Durotheca rogersii]